MFLWIFSSYFHIMSKPSLFQVYLAKFRKFYFEYRTVPTFEISKEIIGVQSKSAVYRFFQQMMEEWYLTKKDGNYYPWDRLVSLPLFESVQAWSPIDVTDPTAEPINVEEYLVDNPTDTVLLKVKWESMMDAGLHEWDVVVVDTSKSARVWDMVIAFVDGQYTVKRLQKWDQTPRELHPDNANFNIIRPQWELSIFGVVVGSMRRY